ncbi:hypothetical protein NL676_002367 [Syzygium grande]|nr:hypothetical protein NL676_002367 [Syzygium grande]
MEDRWLALEDGEPEPISESFTCCVCLDLLYKPVVLPCGHISCFWCVHQSMSGFRETKCPLCRQPYLHFPSICLLLHFLFLKMYPDSYKRREKLTLEEEKRKEIFSPQFDARVEIRNGEPCASEVQSEPIAGIDGNSPSSPKQDLKGKHDLPVEEENGHLVGSDKSCKQITVLDVLCAECKQLLFRPVALNCGHVYCESCIVNPVDEKIKCQVCQSRHPGGLSEVCLELYHFLEQLFSEEYALRRLAARHRLSISKNDSPKCHNGCGAVLIGNNRGDKQKKNSSLKNDAAMIHAGAGCDYCGMHLIIGDRYQCQDCVEKIGLDLYGDCHNSHCKLPSRFNQQHQPEHKFRLKKPRTWRNYMLRLVIGRLLDDGSAGSRPL